MLISLPDVSPRAAHFWPSAGGRSAEYDWPVAGLDVVLDAGADDGPTGRQGPPLTDGGERFLNRELSWLDFNARVLALAEDASLPLLERAKYLAIFSENLDEFFEVRVSGLLEQLDAGLRTTPPDGLDPVEQLRAIRRRVDAL